MKRLVLLLAVLVGSGCFCGLDSDVDPCAHASPPGFSVTTGSVDDSVDGRIRVPSPGTITVKVTAHTDDDGALGSIVVEGDGALESTVKLGEDVFTWTVISLVEMRSQQEGVSVIEARDGCGRASRLEVEAVPVASVHAEAEPDVWSAALPEELTRGGVVLLPGLPFSVEFELLDGDGMPLVGTWHGGPAIEITGGMSVGPVGDRSVFVTVDGPAGPATITVGDAATLEFEVGSVNDAVRLDVWRNARMEGDWWQAWVQGTPVGAELTLPVGEAAALAMHTFDADGRLLIGIDNSRFPHELDAGAEVFVEGSRGLFFGDSLLLGLAPGETTVVARKAGASSSFRLRVVEESLP